VPLEGRGWLPFVDLHREALFVHAVRSLLEVERLAGRVVVTVETAQRAEAVAALDRCGLTAPVQDAHTWWRTLTGGVTVVLHDPLCPLAPVGFLAGCLDEVAAWAEDGPASDVRPGAAHALVAFRPLTDTIKTVVDGRIADTLDRDEFGIVASPAVFGHGADEDIPPTADIAALTAWLRARGAVRLREAPSLGRRVDDASAVTLLECLDELAGTARET
jgi:hypothetical protein